MRIVMPDDVRTIITTLNENGYEAYAVGGCVRDSIIHRVPGDWDITTNALPAQTKALFKRTIDTGLQHGTVTVMMGTEGYEITTYRVDGVYEDGRHPKQVEFTASLAEDLKRRDFTINAMAYNDEVGIVDLFGGEDDIKNGIIRCVGNPQDRFSEDALRMLRAVRFSAQLGFSIEENTQKAIRDLAHTLEKISKERIHTELGKILLSPNPDYIRFAGDLGITANAFDAYDTLEDKVCALELLKALPDKIYFKYAALLMECTAKEAVDKLKELKLDNDTINKVKYLVEYHRNEPARNEVSVRRLLMKIDVEPLKDIITFEREYYRIKGEKELLGAVDNVQALMEKVLDAGDCFRIKDLAINGGDLMEIGIKPGKEMGDRLKRCLEAVIENPELNTKEKLLQL